MQRLINNILFSSGWLGIVLGTKLYINYAKKPFDRAYSETVTELRVALNESDKSHTGQSTKKRKLLFSLLFKIENVSFVSAAPSAQPSSTINDTTSSKTSPTHGVLVHLMSQFRMDKLSEPMPISLSDLEKMSITDTQSLLVESGLEK